MQAGNRTTPGSCSEQLQSLQLYSIRRHMLALSPLLFVPTTAWKESPLKLHTRDSLLPLPVQVPSSLSQPAEQEVGSHVLTEAVQPPPLLCLPCGATCRVEHKRCRPQGVGNLAPAPAIDVLEVHSASVAQPLLQVRTAKSKYTTLITLQAPMPPLAPQGGLDVDTVQCLNRPGCGPAQREAHKSGTEQ